MRDQADQGRRERGVLRTRATEDAEMRRSRMSGQASIELVAALPALLLAALIALQLLAAGYAITLADGAAEAGALALASGGSTTAAARGALPGWAEEDVAVTVRGGTVTVRLRPPSPLRSLADQLVVTSSASARPAP
jgi:hypothetical protein